MKKKTAIKKPVDCVLNGTFSTGKLGAVPDGWEPKWGC